MKPPIKNFAAVLYVTVFLSAAASAGPVSSASFPEALRTAERIVGQNPDWSIYRALGDSMGDYYGSDSLLLVKAARLSDVRVGMMVVYRGRGGELIAHKVVEHNGTWLRTQGVRNERMDPVYLRAEMLVGTVFGVVHASALPTTRIRGSDGRALPTAYCRSF